jgi:hypothetical protein
MKNNNDYNIDDDNDNNNDNNNIKGHNAHKRQAHSGPW